MRYVLLFVDTEQFANDLQAMSPAERERAYQRVEEWMVAHVGKIRGGNKLQSPETATTVRLEGGEPVITDGPFVEGKEVVSRAGRPSRSAQLALMSSLRFGRRPGAAPAGVRRCLLVQGAS